jgi:hypothetical protein
VSSDPRIADIAARLQAATPGPWTVGTAPRPETGQSKADYQNGSLADPDGDTPLWVVWTKDGSSDVDYVVPAITGDGPTSEANAAFVAHARDDVQWLLDQVTHRTGDTARELHKVADTLELVVRHLSCRDDSNAALHMASATRHAPLTVATQAALETVRNLLTERNAR